MQTRLRPITSDADSEAIKGPVMNVAGSRRIQHTHDRFVTRRIARMEDVLAAILRGETVLWPQGLKRAHCNDGRLVFHDRAVALEDLSQR